MRKILTAENIGYTAWLLTIILALGLITRDERPTLAIIILAVSALAAGYCIGFANGKKRK